MNRKSTAAVAAIVLFGMGVMGCAADATPGGTHEATRLLAQKSSSAIDCTTQYNSTNPVCLQQNAQQVLASMMANDTHAMPCPGYGADSLPHCSAGQTMYPQCRALWNVVAQFEADVTWAVNVNYTGNGIGIVNAGAVTVDQPGYGDAIPANVYLVQDFLYQQRVGDLNADLGNAADLCYTQGTGGYLAVNYKGFSYGGIEITPGTTPQGGSVCNTQNCLYWNELVDPGGVTLSQNLSASPAGASAAGTDNTGNAASAYQWPSQCRSNKAASGAPPFVGGEPSSSVALSAGSMTQHNVAVGAGGGCFSTQAKSL